MPPKAKLHKDKGKLKSFPRPVAPVSNNVPSASEPSTSTEDEDFQRQFEVELCWCIQQLQNALNSGKLNQKQIQDTTKTLNTLMNNSAPLIKKRQLMRLTFGDYRAKMLEEERKFNRINHQLKMTTPKPSSKSIFVKKAPFLQSESNFKFNFDIKPEDQAANEISKLNITNSEEKGVKNETQVLNKPFHFQPSENSFRFNFCENTINE